MCRPVIRTTGWVFLLIFFVFEASAQRNTKYRLPDNDLSAAQWIGDAKRQPAIDSLMYEDDPAPVFRKTFLINRPVKSARLYITAAGYYSAAINGKLLNQIYLDPAWTDYSKRIYFSEYDINNLLSQGTNYINVTLGNGFYNPLPLTFWGRLNLREALPVGRPLFIARIELVHHDGRITNIITNDSWEYAYGPVLRNNVYLGEVYDAGRELDESAKAGITGKNWQPAVIKNGPGGRLQKKFFPPVEVIDIKQPVKINEREKGVYVADMGENFAGTFSVRLHGNTGDTVRFRLGERIYEDGRLNPMTAVAGQIKKKGIGGAGAPELAAQEGMYIFGKDTVVEYAPRFSFAVYRYMELSGLKRAPRKDDIQGLALSSNVKSGNQLTTSNHLINSIQEMTTRTFLSNLMSVQSDCPGREKFAYGGDLQATAEAYICNFNMHAFYRKVLYDWVDAVQDSVFIDTAPYVGLKFCGLNFEGAIFDLQYNLFQYYGDTAIIRELYNFDLEWMDKAERIHPTGIVDKGLADHEALVNVPVQLIGTIGYLRIAEIMKGFAALMQDKPNVLRFENLEKKIKNQLREMYWNGSVSMKTVEQQSREASMTYINSLPEEERQQAATELLKSENSFNKQTFYTLLLYSGVIPEKERRGAMDSLLKAIDDAPAGHFTTGIFGTKFILEVLSQYGYADRVFNIVNSTEFPGWGFMIKNGATTLWERWKESDDTYSNCHPMFGSVSAWFYRWLAGVRPVLPGFRKFTINPLLPEQLSTLNCTYNTPRGAIAFSWERKSQGYDFMITVPEASVATFYLPGKIRLARVKDINKNITYMPAEILENNSFDLPAGKYLIQSQ
ncbi:MAG: family 78 glycoside hydrolase catalytic domain [Niabella sp.]